MKLRVGRNAHRQLDRMQAWWSEHRPAAPSAFIDDLEDAFRHICSVPNAGVRWPTPRRPAMRRILMGRTNNHVYFVVDEGSETVRVHAIWGASKGREPKL